MGQLGGAEHRPGCTSRNDTQVIDEIASDDRGAEAQHMLELLARKTLTQVSTEQLYRRVGIAKVTYPKTLHESPPENSMASPRVERTQESRVT